MRGEHRVHDLLELLERCRITEHPRRQLLPIDLAIRCGAGKRRFDCRCSLIGIHRMDRRVGVIDRHALFGEHLQSG